MAGPMPGFRRLFHLLEESEEGSQAYRDVLLPYQPQALEMMSALRAYGSLDAMAWRRDQSDPCSGGDRRQYYSCLEHLYALARVSDLLLLPFQPVREPGAEYVWSWAPNIQLEERNEWLRSLGMRAIEQETFHPFYHEIVEVEQAPDPDESITLLETIWPGFMLGQMLFCRAGARIRAGAHVARKDIAERSRLYWAYARNNRPTYGTGFGALLAFTRLGRGRALRGPTLTAIPHNNHRTGFHIIALSITHNPPIDLRLHYFYTLHAPCCFGAACRAKIACSE